MSERNLERLNIGTCIVAGIILVIIINSLINLFINNGF